MQTLDPEVEDADDDGSLFGGDEVPEGQTGEASTSVSLCATAAPSCFTDHNARDPTQNVAKRRVETEPDSANKKLRQDVDMSPEVDSSDESDNNLDHNSDDDADGSSDE